MAHGSRVCPSCGRINSVDDKSCFHCGKGLPGPMASSLMGVFGNFSEDGLPATKLLMGACILVYALCMVSDGPAAVLSRGRGLMDFGSFTSSTLLRVGALWGRVVDQEPWRVLSAVFAHGSLLHIGMNMLSLARLGSTLEPHFRSARFLLLYVVSGALGFVCTVWMRGGAAFSVGASGGIFGLLGAFIGALIVRRNPGWQQVFFSNLIMAGALAFYVPNVDNSAHAGGFVAGLVLGILLELERQPRKRDRLVTALSVAGGLAVVASIILSARSPVWKAYRSLEEAQAERAEQRRIDPE